MLLTVSSPFQRNLTAYETVRSTISSSMEAASALNRSSSFVVLVAGPSQQKLCGVRINSMRTVAAVKKGLLDSNSFRRTSSSVASPTLVYFSTQETVIGTFHSIISRFIALCKPSFPNISTGSADSLDDLVSASSKRLYNSVNNSIVSGEFSKNTIYYSVSMLNLPF